MPELMKGKKWRDRKHKMTFPAFAEIKYDEIRCHVIVTPLSYKERRIAGGAPDCMVQFWSYAGKPLHNLESFEQDFAELWATSGHAEFDCGFEANGNFADSYRWVRSSKGLPEDLKGKPTRFILFDLPCSKNTYVVRLSELAHVIQLARIAGFDNIEQTEREVVETEEDVEAMFVRVRATGVEGLMVKTTDHKYERGGRPDTWQKVKPEEDADGVIQEIIEAVSEAGEPLGRAGSVRIDVLEEGPIFATQVHSSATPHGIPHELGREMFQHPEKFIGQWAEFKYMERDRQGGYRHPVWHRLREAKA